MKAILPLFIMVDACGWEIAKNDPFAQRVAPNRKRLRSVFGYSSTCVPSILSGRWPDEHRNWCYFVYDPVHSPFAALKSLRFVPKAISSRRIVRRMLTKVVKKQLGFKGYFDLYNIPFEQIYLYDFTEKKSPLKPGGMNRGGNIFDFLEDREIPYFVSDPDNTEEQNLVGLEGSIRDESIDFAFCYWPGLDGLLHRVGNKSPEIPARLRMYDQWFDRVMAMANRHYTEVRLYIFSDHGMANCDLHVDLKSKVESLGLNTPEDYAVVYDSTMARFWFFNENARQKVANLLSNEPEGRIIPDSELKDLRAWFPDRYFGELIFLVKEGALIVPSHMGERPITAMHGYHPDDPQSYALLCTNQETIPSTVEAIPHIYNLMTAEATAAHSAAPVPKTTSMPELQTASAL
jgi:hypothetical protein